MMATTAALAACGGSSGSRYAEDSVKVTVSTPEPPKLSDTLTAVEKDSVVKSLPKDFYVVQNKVNGKVKDVYPKTKPSYRNVNKVYCYFRLDSTNTPSEFRMVIQHVGNRILMATSAVFIVEGKKYGYTPIEFIRQSEMADTLVQEWEWTDEELSRDYDSMMEALDASDHIIVKLNGQYPVIRELSVEEVRYIHRAWRTYRLLGGKLPVSTL